MINYARDHSTADALDYIAIWNAAMFAPSNTSRKRSPRKRKNERRRFPDLAALRERM